MTQAIKISRQDMHDFMTANGYKPITLRDTRELVYGKIVKPNLCLRVYTSVVGEETRDTGADAIRCVLVTKINGVPHIIGADKRVHRVEGWRKNLQDRLDNWQEQLGPACPQCGGLTVRRQSRKGPFWGCAAYPQCRSIQPIVPVRRVPAVVHNVDDIMAGLMDTD